jgi:hypothetical protein
MLTRHPIDHMLPLPGVHASPTFVCHELCTKCDRIKIKSTLHHMCTTKCKRSRNIVGRLNTSMWLEREGTNEDRVRWRQHKSDGTKLAIAWGCTHAGRWHSVANASPRQRLRPFYCET